MKISELLFFIACFAFIIGLFLKMPKMLFVCSSPLSGKLPQPGPKVQFTSRCGTAMFVLFPALVLISCSYEDAFVSRGSWGKSEGVKRITFVLLASFLLVMYGFVLGGLYLVKRFIKEFFAGLIKDLESSLEQFKPASARGGGKKSKGFFYEAGQNFAKGVAENTPGDEWKYPKDDDEDEDENPPRNRGPHNRWN